MPERNVNTASPEVARAMRAKGVESCHMMGLRSDLESSPEQIDQDVLRGLNELEEVHEVGRQAASEPQK